MKDLSFKLRFVAFAAWRGDDFAAQNHPKFRRKVVIMKQKLFFIILFFLFSIFFLSCCAPSDPDKVVNKSENRIVVAECSESQIVQRNFPVNTKEAYRVGLNKEGMMIFYSTEAALAQLQEDYGDAIAQLQEEFGLEDVTERTIHSYGVLGWQSGTKDKELKDECHLITDFFGIYENSFKSGYYYDFYD